MALSAYASILPAEDMGVVLAYEIARRIAQRGDGLEVDDDCWMMVEGGAGLDP
jgi:hypothetical protein